MFAVVRGFLMSEIKTIDKSDTKDNSVVIIQRKRREKKTLSQGTALTDMSKNSRDVYVEKVQVNWTALNRYEMFSTSPDGSDLKVKSSKSAYIDLLTGQRVIDIVSGKAYRVRVI